MAAASSAREGPSPPPLGAAEAFLGREVEKGVAPERGGGGGGGGGGGRGIRGGGGAPTPTSIKGGGDGSVKTMLPSLSFEDSMAAAAAGNLGAETGMAAPPSPGLLGEKLINLTFSRGVLAVGGKKGWPDLSKWVG